MNYTCHETAVIDPGCHIGTGSQVWHFCHLSAGCVIGENCSLGQNVYVASHVTVGNRVKIQNNVSLYDGVTLEDDVFVGPSAVFTNVTNPRATVSRKQEYRSTLIKHGATIGANATIVCGATLGQHCFIAAGAVVSAQCVPNYALMAGVPARQIGWMSRHGCRLNLLANHTALCPQSGEKYQLIGRELKLVSPLLP